MANADNDATAVVAKNKKNWKTTAAGILGAIGILSTQLSAILDDDPTTSLDIKVIVTALGVLGIGFLARDKDVSSKKSGIE